MLQQAIFNEKDVCSDFIYDEIFMDGFAEHIHHGTHEVVGFYNGMAVKVMWTFGMNYLNIYYFPCLGTEECTRKQLQDYMMRPNKSEDSDLRIEVFSSSDFCDSYRFYFKS